MKQLCITLLSLLLSAACCSQPRASYTEEDIRIFRQYLAHMEPYKASPKSEVMEKTALFFLARPYVAHTLEESDEEVLTVNLREFDCVTFMESVLALSKTLKEDAPDFAAFMQTLQQIRYRNGKVEDYASRIHYTSDWVYENERQGLLRNISSDLGGILEKKKIDFISTHREAYRQLKKDDALWHRIVTMEKNLNDRGGFHYLPKADIASQAAQIPHMAIIAFVTRIEGLDTSHVGFVFHKEDRLTFIHASSARKQVVVDEKTLHDYCAGQKGCVGIIVAEVL